MWPTSFSWHACLFRHQQDHGRVREQGRPLNVSSGGHKPSVISLELNSVLRLAVPAPERDKAQILAVLLVDPVATSTDPSRPSDHQRLPMWTSESIILISAEGHVQTIGPVCFKAPSIWSGSNRDLVIMGQYTLDWAYDHKFPLVQRSGLKARVHPSSQAVKLTCVVVCDHVSGPPINERELRGWKCAFCCLGDLGGEEELHTHYAVLHGEECEVEAGPREMVRARVNWEYC